MVWDEQQGTVSQGQGQEGLLFWRLGETCSRDGVFHQGGRRGRRKASCPQNFLRPVLGGPLPKQPCKVFSRKLGDVSRGRVQLRRGCGHRPRPGLGPGPAGGLGQKQGWVECTALQTWCGALSLKNTQTCRPVKSPAGTTSTSFSFHDWNRGSRNTGCVTFASLVRLWASVFSFVKWE